MNNELWKKIMAVARKTGDKVIVVDEADGASVVMDFEQYCRLVEKGQEEDLTDEELLDKINHGIEFPQLSEAADAVADEKETIEEDDYYIEPIE